MKQGMPSICAVRSIIKSSFEKKNERFKVDLHPRMCIQLSIYHGVFLRLKPGHAPDQAACPCNPKKWQPLDRAWIGSLNERQFCNQKKNSRLSEINRQSWHPLWYFCKTTLQSSMNQPAVQVPWLLYQKPLILPRNGPAICFSWIFYKTNIITSWNESAMLS